MQVSFACTEHNLKSRSEDRLCGLRAAPPPGGSSGGCGGAGGGGERSNVQVSNGNYAPQNSVKIRDITGSRGVTQGHAHMKEAFGRHSNMKYR
ncbi:voltage-gated potassium channel subunit beta-3 [Tachysurus ichikawai]